MANRKKLIEVALPLEEINHAAAREKSIRHGHPSTLHLWWARRPLAAARAVLFASLVDDPSSDHLRGLFPTEEAQSVERQRLHDIIKKLVIWENIDNEEVFKAAQADIIKSCDGNPPPVYDPFAGGGSIPLEAQRLGLEAHASDLNPVAVLINKALIEIPPRFAGNPPVNPKANERMSQSAHTKGVSGLAEDVRYYGEWMKEHAIAEVGHHYPQAELKKGELATVIAWLWTRIVRCPNPACGAQMPLVNSFELSRKKGKEAWVLPVVREGSKLASFEVQHGRGSIPEGTVKRSGARCICCGQPVGFDYIRSEGQAGRMSAQLMAVVADTGRGRAYLSPTEKHVRAAEIERPSDYPDGDMPEQALGFSAQAYGMVSFTDLFTNRQLTTLVTFSDLVQEAIQEAHKDAHAAGMSDDDLGLDAGGSGAKAYGEAVGVYLACAVSKLLDRNSSLCSWDASRDSVRNTFARQALPMVWDYAEANIFSQSSGCWSNCIEWVYKCLLTVSPITSGIAIQLNAAQQYNINPVVVSTDPPYYDNIGYADLSDFFYIWLRRSLQSVYPRLFSTMLVPKAEELVATPYRFGGSKETAKRFFEDGMLRAFTQLRNSVSSDYPLTVYYAFKQSESETSDDDTSVASSGWETMLQALLSAGFSIVGTWPVRTEGKSRMRAINSNALASSIVLVCRPRAVDAPVASLRVFLGDLRSSLRSSLHTLQSANIAPVDLAQSAIGPGMSVFSGYSQVLEADGTPMSVRSALQIINQEIDLFFNEQDGELDSDSRFCIDVFTQFAFNDMKFGEADVLARAKNTSVDRMKTSGFLYSDKGIVRLLTREELPSMVNPDQLCIWLHTQQLTSAMETGGVAFCAEIVTTLSSSISEQAKALAYRLYTIAERKGWAQEAYVYNNLVISWPEIQSRATELRAETGASKQSTLF